MGNFLSQLLRPRGRDRAAEIIGNPAWGDNKSGLVSRGLEHGLLSSEPGSPGLDSWLRSGGAEESQG